MVQAAPLTLAALAALGAFVALGCGGRSVSVENGAGGTGSGGTGEGATGGHHTGGGGNLGGTGGSLGGDAGSSGTGGSSGQGCGNLSVELGEECDDGNLDSGDGCNQACRLEPGAVCPPFGGPCYFTSLCGDGLLSRGETCDDGNTSFGDGCAGDCSSIELGWECRVPGKRCTPRCGDGRITGSEQCDDENRSNGDGCSLTCLIEPGSSCTGEPSQCTRALCGDGVVEAGEGCDLGGDNGHLYGDGSGCTVRCTPQPDCGKGACDTYCGDGNIDGGEQCDDGNGFDNDGCSAACEVEPGFSCAGLDTSGVVPCPSNPNYECLLLPVTYRDFDGQETAGGHPDFFFLGATALGGRVTGIVDGAGRTTCVPDSGGAKAGFSPGGPCPTTDAAGECPGLVEATLGADGKPVLAKKTCPCVFTDRNATGLIDGLPGVDTCTLPHTGASVSHIDTTVQVIQSKGSFAQWFAPSEFTRKTLEVNLELVLSSENLASFESSYPDATAGVPSRTAADDLHANCYGYDVPLTSGFFPLEFGASTKHCNLTPYSLYGDVTDETDCVSGVGHAALWQWDPRAAYDACPVNGDGGPVPSSTGVGKPVQGVQRNFHFTTEAHYLFRYLQPTLLSATGNDDIWIFVNGKLALDLGGTRSSGSGDVRIDAGSFDLEPGKVYPIAIFQANRSPPTSNFRLTLPPSVSSLSSCQPTCGDGVATAAEECDLGTKRNTGEYGGCTADCRFAGYCGDGIVNGPEECDDAANNGVSYGAGGCTLGCQRSPFCGDGFVDTAYGELCDGSPDCPSTCVKQLPPK